MFALAVGAGFGALEFYFQSESVSYAIFSALFILACALVGGVVGSRIQPRLAANRTARKYPPGQRSMTTTVSPSGFRVESPNVSVSLSWKTIERVVESKDYFLLFVSSSRGYFIPKSAAHGQDLAYLRKLLKDKVEDCHLANSGDSAA